MVRKYHCNYFSVTFFFCFECNISSLREKKLSVLAVKLNKAKR